MANTNSIKKLDEMRNDVYSIDSEINKLKNDFDPVFYKKTYPELVGTDAQRRQHYSQYGIIEGRVQNQYQYDTKTGVENKDLINLENKKKKLVSDIGNLESELNTESSIRSLSQSAIDTKKTGGIPQLVSSNDAVSKLSDYASSTFANKLNYQVSDDQILSDYNTSKLSRLNSIIDRGNAQITGIQQRLGEANALLDGLPSDSPQRKSSQDYINQLNSDLSSVTGAVTDATQQVKNFKPITSTSPEAAKEITSFRSFLQLPEERASQQLRQIDPESYKTSVALGQQYRQMATEPIGATTTPETEQIRKTIEDEALNQLRLGSTIGAEELRGYEQAIRGAQTARGNIFGLGPAVQEAAQIGAAGEQRKLARYGAAQSFLGSGQSTGDALKADIAFRDALLQNRLGAASGFVAGGPSIYNLSQARTGQQQGAMQQYIQANQALPGGFNQQPSTAANFYQTTSPEIPVQLTNAFNQLYRSQADYLGSTYGAQVGAISRQPSGSEQFGQIATGLGNLIKI